MKKSKKLIPNHFLLIPGIGAQGGSLKNISNLGFSKECGLLINSSRNIIYADSSIDFQDKIALEAQNIQMKMKSLLEEQNLI